jgi:hypothetical protein
MYPVSRRHLPYARASGSLTGLAMTESSREIVRFEGESGQVVPQDVCAAMAETIDRLAYWRSAAFQ